ncbi:MAG: MDR family MFS transporter [Bacillus sp. (in: firmicutes)]
MRFADWDTNLKVRLGGEALVNIAFWMFFPFLAIYFSEEFGKTTAGFLIAGSQGLAVIANLMGGYCADRFGRKTMMVIASCGQGIGYLFFAYASSPWLDSAIIGFMCFTLVSIFSSFYWPASQAMIADLVPEKDRSGVFAVFYTSLNLAVVIGPLLGSIFYANHRFELLLFAGVANLILSLLLFLVVTESAPLQKKGSDGQVEGGWSFLKSQVSQYGIILKDFTFMLFIVAGILLSMTFLQLDLLYPVYTKEVISDQSLVSIGDWSWNVNGEQAFGLLIAENGLLVVLFTVYFTKLMDRFRERHVFIASALSYGAAMLIASSTHWIWGLILSMLVFSIAELMTVGIQNSFISKIAPEEMRGQYFAAASLRYTIGRMIAPLAIPLTEWVGNSLTFVILSLFALLGAFTYHFMFIRFEQQTARA